METLEPYLKYAPLFGGISALVAAIALGINAYQLHKAIRWNRLQAAFTYFPNMLALENLENELDEAIRFWSRKEPLTIDEVRLLLFQAEMTAENRQGSLKKMREILQALGRKAPTDDDEFLLELRRTGRKLKAYLNEIERYSAAINAGVVDSDTAKSVYSAKFEGHYRKIGTLVKHMQEERNSGIYVELERVVERWKSKPASAKEKY